MKMSAVLFATAMSVAVAATAFADNASAGPINTVSSPVIKTPSVTEQIYYRRYRGRYYRRGYAYGGYGYGYGYPSYSYPVAPLPLPFFGW